MRITLKRISMVVLTVILLVSSVYPCFATTQDGKITVMLVDREKNHINGVQVNICQIAELNHTGYFPSKAFENSGISIAGVLNNRNETVAKTVVDYIKKHDVDTISEISENGMVSFAELGMGIWLVFPEEDGKYTFSPYIVLLPFESGGKLCYEVSSVPKMEDNTPNEIHVYVIKKWDDKNNASKKRPNMVTIELLRDDALFSSIVLSEENGWAHTFRELPKDGKYSVREKSVANYKADYSGDATNGFVVTNTYVGEKLPQTGQYWWPIVLIAIVGVCFVLLGVYEIGVKKNGKKE